MPSLSFEQHIQKCEEDYSKAPEFQKSMNQSGFHLAGDYSHPKNLTVKVKDYQERKNLGELTRVFDDLPHHDNARYEFLFNAYKEAVSALKFEAYNELKENSLPFNVKGKDVYIKLVDNKNAQEKFEKYLHLVNKEACQDLLNEKGELKENIVKVLKLNELKGWNEDREQKQAITRAIIVAYIVHYTTGRFAESAELNKFQIKEWAKHFFAREVDKKASINPLVNSADEIAAFDGRIHSAYKEVQLENMIKKFIDIDAKLESDAARDARARMIEALKSFWKKNQVKCSPDEFKELCAIAMNVLSIRQKYDVEKSSKWRQSDDKKKMMLAIENEMIGLLDPSIAAAKKELDSKMDSKHPMASSSSSSSAAAKKEEPQKGDLKQSVAEKICRAMYGKIFEQENAVKAEMKKQEAKNSSLLDYMKEASSPLENPLHIQAYPMILEVMDLKSPLEKEAHTARDNMIKALNTFWANSPDPKSRKVFTEACRMAQSVLAVRQQYDKTPKTLGQSSSKKAIMAAIEEKMVGLLKNEQARNIDELEKKIGLTMANFIDDKSKNLDQKTFYNYLGEAANQVRPFYNNLTDLFKGSPHEPLDDAGLVARNKMVKALLVYRNSHSHQKVPQSVFKHICDVAEAVLSIRQQYHTKKTGWISKISKEKMGVITNIENAMIQLLDPNAQTDAKDAKHLSADSPADVVASITKVIGEAIPKEDKENFTKIMKGVHKRLTTQSTHFQYMLGKDDKQVAADNAKFVHAASAHKASSTTDLAKSLAKHSDTPSASAATVLSAPVGSSSSSKKDASPEQSKTAAAAAPTPTLTPSRIPKFVDSEKVDERLRSLAPAGQAKKNESEPVIDTTRHFKIWFSKDEKVWMPMVNQLRLIRHRKRHPDHKIYLVGAKRLLSEKAKEQQEKFCRDYNIHYLDIDNDLPALINKQKNKEQDSQLLKLANDQINRYFKKLNDGLEGNLAAASDVLRWMQVLLDLGCYSDLDVDIDFKRVPKEIRGHELLIPCNLTGHHSKVFFGNNNFIATSQDCKIADAIRTELIAASEKAWIDSLTLRGSIPAIDWVPELYGPYSVNRAIFSYFTREKVEYNDLNGRHIPLVSDGKVLALGKRIVLHQGINAISAIEAKLFNSNTLKSGDLSWMPDSKKLITPEEKLKQFVRLWKEKKEKKSSSSAPKHQEQPQSKASGAKKS